MKALLLLIFVTILAVHAEVVIQQLSKECSGKRNTTTPQMGKFTLQIEDKVYSQSSHMACVEIPIRDMFTVLRILLDHPELMSKIDNLFFLTQHSQT